MTTALNRLILFLAIVSQLALGTGKGMVLCVESDGSVRLEIASIACCEPQAVHDLHGREGQEACSREDGDCGGCTDQDLLILETPKGKHSLPPLFARPHVAATVWNPADRLEHTLRVPRPADGRIACLKSVVLRC